MRDTTTRSQRRSKKPNPLKGLDHPAIAYRRDAAGPGWWLLRFDGSCEGNGNRGATGRWGFHLQDERYHTLKVGSGETDAGIVTNNQSEWQGVLHGIRAAYELPLPSPAGLLIEGDSMLVIRVLSGRWASKKPELTVLRDECRDWLAAFGVPWSTNWIPREENEYCDALT